MGLTGLSCFGQSLLDSTNVALNKEMMQNVEIRGKLEHENRELKRRNEELQAGLPCPSPHCTILAFTALPHWPWRRCFAVLRGGAGSLL